jgi:excisionase family DNA binding protein
METQRETVWPYLSVGVELSIVHRRHSDGKGAIAMTTTQSDATKPHWGRVALSIAEVSAVTGLGRDGVYAAINSGKLVARKFGRRTIITDDDLRQFLAGLPRAGGHEQACAVTA